MNAVSVIGSGRSSVFLIEYLFHYCENNAIPFAVYDKDAGFIRQALPEHMLVCIHPLDVSDNTALESLVANSQLVVSMLPAFMHPVIAALCLKLNVHLATASYVSDDMNAMHLDVQKADLVFMNEAGLDPGIDHMSAMKIMDDLRGEGAVITGFKSYCGGLVADEDDGDNPWKYKFSWNPRNVVLAAQGAPAQFLENGKMKLLPYQQIFNSAVTCAIEGYGHLEAYPNRDSLKYLEVYGLHEVKDMLRGTFRKTGFSKAWQVFVMLGMTDDLLQLHLPQTCTMADWLEMYLPKGEGDLKQRLKNTFQLNDDEVYKFEWLDFFSQTPLPIYSGTSAKILEEVLKSRWVLGAHNRDLVVMQHQISYSKDNASYLHESTMVIKGDSNTHTAMAKTVGLPLAIACKLIIENGIRARGILTPVTKEVYSPILEELKTLGIDFKDKISVLA